MKIKGAGVYLSELRDSNSMMRIGRDPRVSMAIIMRRFRDALRERSRSVLRHICLLQMEVTWNIVSDAGEVKYKGIAVV